MRKFLLLIILSVQFVSVRSELLYFNHNELHLRFTLDTETKEAYVGTGEVYYNEGSDILRYADALYCSIYEEPNYEEWWKNLVIPQTVECVGEGLQVDGDSWVNVNDLFTVVGLKNGAFWNTTISTISLPITVTEIPPHTFRFCYGLKHVELNNCITSIGESAFRDCRYLEHIELSDELLYIGEAAFADCWNLESISIPSKVQEIANDAFSWCTSLTSVTIEDGEVDLHCGYSWIRSMSHDDNYDMEARGIFGDCPIDTLYIGRNIYGGEWGNNYYPPFLGLDDYGTPGGDGYYLQEGKFLNKVTFGDNVTVISKQLLYKCYMYDYIVLPPGLTTIESEALSFSPSTYGMQRELVLPETVTTIECDAFKNWLGLSVVYANPIVPPYPMSPSQFDTSIFKDIAVVVPSGSGNDYRTHEFWKDLSIIDPSDDLLTVNVKTPGTLYSRLLSQGYQANNVYKLKLKGVLNEDDWAVLKGMNKLYELDLSEIDCEELSSDFLNEDVLLYNFKFSNTTTRIPDGLFYENKTLSLIDIPENCEYIGENAFCNTNVRSLHINGEVTIKKYAFMYCSTLDSLVINNKAIIEENAFCMSGIKSLYIGGVGTSIGEKAFSSCEKMTFVTFADSISYIGPQSFIYCDKLEKLEFNGYIDTIDNCGWNNVKDVYVSDLSKWCNIMFTTVKANPLFYAENFYVNGEIAIDITIPNDVTRINDYTFYNCKELTNVRFHDDIKGFGNNAFHGCNFENLLLPYSLEYISDSAFYKCQRLIELKLPLSLKFIGESAFANCSNMQLVIADWEDPFVISDNTFAAVSDDCLLYIPILTAAKYLQANWNLPNMREVGVISVHRNVGGTISLSFDEDSGEEMSKDYYFTPYLSFNVTMTPDEGFSLYKVKLNGINVTDSVENNTLLIEEPEENLTLAVVFADNSIAEGDVNGDGVVNDMDVIRVMKHIVKDDTQEFYDYVSDPNEDDVINVTDAIMILRNINNGKVNKKNNL